MLPESKSQSMCSGESVTVIASLLLALLLAPTVHRLAALRGLVAEGVTTQLCRFDLMTAKCTWQFCQ
jgi:hypothetical protein